ncbi:hypothetical protein [Methanobrevibacter sp.]
MIRTLMTRHYLCQFSGVWDDASDQDGVILPIMLFRWQGYNCRKEAMIL